MKITERIQKYIDFKGISKYKFCKDNGFSNGFLDKNREIATDKYAKILVYLKDVNPTWLLTGKGKMIIDRYHNDDKEHSLNDNIDIYKLRTDSNYINQMIPIYDIDAIAGILPILSDLQSTKPIDHLYIPNAPRCDGAIYASGDSMYPLLKSGDILAFKIIEDFINDVYWGEMYILYIEVADDIFRTVKYIQKGKNEKYFKLVSQNKHHEDKEVLITKIKAMAQVKITVRIN